MIWNFEKFSNNTAFIANDKSISYKELNSLNNELYSKIKKRTLIAILSANTLGCLLGYTCFLNNNIAVLMLNEKIEKNSFNDFLCTYKPEFVWMPQSSDFFDILNDKVCDSLDYVLVKTGYDTTPINDELAVLVTTSGSISSKKLVRQSYKNISLNMSITAKCLKTNSDDRVITTLPINYTFAISIVNRHLFVGATIVLSDFMIMQKDFWDLLTKMKITSFGGVCYTYEILDRIAFFKKDLPFLKNIWQSGGKLNDHLQEKFAKWAIENNKNFIITYGQTEATAMISYLPTHKTLEKIGSIGTTIPGGKIELINNNELITEPNKPAELVYTGENVALGYADCLEDLNKGDEFGGCIYTGDIAYFDEDGFFHIVGRKKRFIKLYGNRISLDECEIMLQKQFKDFEIACVGEDDNMIIYITDLKFTDAIINYLVAKTSIFPKAFKVKFIEKIPRNEAGKIQYQNILI